MRITFVVPELSLAGGIRVIADYAKRLGARGHVVTVVWPRPRRPSLRERARDLLRGGRAPSSPPRAAPGLGHFEDGATHCSLIECVEDTVTADSVPDGDVVVASWWASVEAMHRFPESKGVKVHFIQGDDTQTPGQPMERVLESWRSPAQLILVAPWLRARVRELVGDYPMTVVLNGVDTTLFQAPIRGKSARPRVGYMYSRALMKGCDVIGEALHQARAECPELEVVAFGEHLADSSCPMPDFVAMSQSPRQAAIREIYGSCDAWLWGSRVEGFGLPMLEAMACRTPVIATPAGAARELLSTGAGRLVKMEDPASMAAAILEICRMDQADWRLLSDKAYAMAQSRSCDAASLEFEAALASFHQASLNRRRSLRPTSAM